jgi:hypothetical protein
MNVKEIVVLQKVEFSKEEIAMLVNIFNSLADNMEMEFDDALDHEEYLFVNKIYDIARQHNLT